jgi:hypothetical protein
MFISQETQYMDKLVRLLVNAQHSYFIQFSIQNQNAFCTHVGML